MIQLVPHSRIDHKKWDACLDSSKNSSIYCYSWYLSAVCDEWDALVMDDYIAVMPIPIQRKMGIKVFYQPFFSRQLGIFSAVLLTPENRAAFIEAIPEEIKLTQVGFDPADLQLFGSYRVNYYQYQIMPLDKGIDSVREGYSNNATRLVKKANGEGYEVRAFENYSAIVQMFRETKGSSLRQFSRQDYEKLEALMTVSASHEVGFGLGVYSGSDELVATGFFIRSGSRITYLKGAVLDVGKRNGAMYLLFDHVFSSNITNATTFDFGGSRNLGVATFYKKFGAQDDHYLFVEKNDLPPAQRAMRKLKHMFS